MKAPQSPRDRPPMSVAVVQKTPSTMPVKAIDAERQAATATKLSTLTATKPKTAPQPIPVITITRRPRLLPSDSQAKSVLRPPIAIPAPIAIMIQTMPIAH